MSDFFSLHWRERLTEIVDLMREISRVHDPMTLREVYSQRMAKLFKVSRRLSLSRRDLQHPYVRITGDSFWKEKIDPWRDREQLPVISGGLLAELIYGDEPHIINDLHVAENEPAIDYLRGYRSLTAVPLFDNGEGLNMVVTLLEEPNGFQDEHLPENVWLANLFGRATYSQMLSRQLRESLETIDEDLKRIADIQRSLLPTVTPKIPTLDLAVYYQTSKHAGGDYYDFFPMADGRVGILIADVSGHGTPAAVHMAITHSLARAYGGELNPPGLLLKHLNRCLTQHYTSASGAFVTAFFAIYDPEKSTIRYASAGHNPPRVVRCSDGSRYSLNGVQRLPLGISEEEEYPDVTFELQVGDQIIFYTDGITEATNPKGEMFTPERLDTVLEHCPIGAEAMLKTVLDALEDFTAGESPADDRTLLVAKKTE